MARRALGPIKRRMRYSPNGYLDGSTGRFIIGDTLVPEPGNSQAFNRYAYALGNPVGLVDPTGHCASVAYDYYDDCRAYLENEFCLDDLCNSWSDFIVVNIQSIWSREELTHIRTALIAVKRALEANGFDFGMAVGGTRFERFNMDRIPSAFDRRNSIYDQHGNLVGLQMGHRNSLIGLSNEAFERANLHFSLVHEIGHAVNYKLGGMPLQHYHQEAGSTNQTAKGYYYRNYGANNLGEGWADAFASFVLSSNSQTQYRYAPLPGDQVYTNWDLMHHAVFKALDMSMGE